MKDLIIIGAGPAGLTAAIYGIRAGLDLTILEKLSNGEESNKDEKWPSSSLLQACRVALLRANGRWQEADRLEALTESSTAAELQVAPPTPGCL